MGVTVLFISFFIFILLGAPIALALGGSSALYIALFSNVSPIVVLQQMLASVNTFTLLAVPFFIMAGALMESGGISRRIVSFCQALVGHFTGGLALVVVLASVFFAAMTGSGVAACAAVGGAYGSSRAMDALSHRACLRILSSRPETSTSTV